MFNNIYDQDGLRSLHNHEFMDETAFQAAYARGVKAVGTCYKWHWRVHTGLWAASMAAHLPGDFVECGVNKGFMSSAIMNLLNWNTQDRCFYLLDTFNGVDCRYLSAADIEVGVVDRNNREINSGFYTFDIESVRQNFSEWKNTKIIVGAIPESLPQIESNRIAFVHLDLNCSKPEVAASEFLWDRIVPGGLILMDDYGYVGYRSQKLGMDEFAKTKNLPILSLPTGQGLLMKPAIVRDGDFNDTAQ